MKEKSTLSEIEEDAFFNSLRDDRKAISSYPKFRQLVFPAQPSFPFQA